MSKKYIKGFGIVELSLVLAFIGMSAAIYLGSASIINGSALKLFYAEVESVQKYAKMFRDMYHYMPGEAPIDYMWSRADFTNICAPSPAPYTVSSVEYSRTGDGGLDYMIDTISDATLFDCHLMLAFRDVDWRAKDFKFILPRPSSRNSDASQAYGVYPIVGQHVLPVFYKNKPYGFIGGWLAVTRSSSRKKNNFLNPVAGFHDCIIVSNFSPTEGGLLGFLTPKEAYALDVKFDDGRPNVGNIIASQSQTFGFGGETMTFFNEEFDDVDMTESDMQGIAGPGKCYTFRDNVVDSFYNLNVKKPVCNVGFFIKW